MTQENNTRARRKSFVDRMAERAAEAPDDAAVQCGAQLAAAGLGPSLIAAFIQVDERTIRRWFTTSVTPRVGDLGRLRKLSHRASVAMMEGKLPAKGLPLEDLAVLLKSVGGT